MGIVGCDELVGKCQVYTTSGDVISVEGGGGLADRTFLLATRARPQILIDGLIPGTLTSPEFCEEREHCNWSIRQSRVQRGFIYNQP